MIRILVAASFLCSGGVLVAQSAQYVIPDGKLLAVGQYCYTMTASTGGITKPVGVTFQSVRREQIHGLDALAIVVHQHMYSGKFDMRDSFLLRSNDLRPILLDTDRNGSPHVHLEYGEDRIFGWEMVGTTKKMTNVKLSGPVWDGNLWGLTFAALPLKAGASITLPTYQYDSGLGTFYLDAIDEHDENIPTGTVRAWRIKAGLSRTERVEYTVSNHPGLEIAYTAAPSSQRIGGDCSGIN